MSGGTVARDYHRLTSCWSDGEWRAPIEDPRALKSFETDVLVTFPAPCKSYPAGLPVVELPRRWRPGGGSATAVLAGGSRQRERLGATGTLENVRERLTVRVDVSGGKSLAIEPAQEPLDVRRRDS